MTSGPGPRLLGPVFTESIRPGRKLRALDHVRGNIGIDRLRAITPLLHAKIAVPFFRDLEHAHHLRPFVLDCLPRPSPERTMKLKTRIRTQFLRLRIPTGPVHDACRGKDFTLSGCSGRAAAGWECGIMPFCSEQKMGLHHVAVAPVVSSFLSETRAPAVACFCPASPATDRSAKTVPTQTTRLCDGEKDGHRVRIRSGRSVMIPVTPMAAQAATMPTSLAV